MGFLQRPRSACPPFHAGLGLRPLHRRCLPAGPAGGSGVLERYETWWSFQSAEESVSYSGQHVRAFTRGNDVPRNPQTLFSGQGTEYLFFPSRTKTETEGRFPPHPLKGMGVHRHVSYEAWAVTQAVKRTSPILSFPSFEETGRTRKDTTYHIPAQKDRFPYSCPVASGEAIPQLCLPTGEVTSCCPDTGTLWLAVLVC